jgi:choline dehydrogenase-like flavoprotein
MIREPARISGDVRERADVCVVGSGAGGAVFAAECAAAGLRVVVLERGGRYTREDFNQREADMIPRLYADRGLRATKDLSITILQGSCLGGSSTINWTTSLRTPAHVLEAWARDYRVEGMSPAEMRPAFERVEAMTQVRVPADDEHNANNRILLDGARVLGWSAHAIPRNVVGCVRSGFCGLGCAYDAKKSVLITYIPDAERHGAVFYTNARADRIETRGPRDHTVRATICDKHTGRPLHALAVRASAVAVACGPIDTPVLLERSGLARRSGQLGRNLALHPTSAVMGVFAREIYMAGGIPQSAVCDQFADRDGTGGFLLEAVPAHPVLAAPALPGFGAEHRALMRAYPWLGATIVLVKDGAGGPAPGRVRATRSGRPEIEYALLDDDVRLLMRGLQRAAELQLAAGAREVRTLQLDGGVIRTSAEARAIPRWGFAANRIGLFSAHPMGTARMGGDRRYSVVDSHGELHDARGIFVTDASVFPTSLGVNPHITVMATATHFAHHLLAERQRYFA